MFVAVLLSSVLSLAQDPVVRVPQDGQRVTLGQETGRAIAPCQFKIYEVRDLLEHLGSWSEGTDADSARRELEFRIQRYLESQRTLREGQQPDEAALKARLESLDREQRLAESSKGLARIVSTFIEPKLSGPSQSVAALNVGGSLVANATPEQHAWIDAFLKRQRQAVDSIEIETRFLVGPRGCFKALADQASKTFAMQEAVDSALAAITAPLDVIHAPRVVCFNLWQVSIETAEELAYIKEYQVRFVEPGPQQIADPVVETVRAGTFVKARAFELRDGFYGLSLDTSLVDVKRPIATRKVRISVAGMEEAEVGVPEVTRMQFTADVQLADGGSALFVTPRDEQHDLALVVSVRRGAPVERPAPVDPPERK